MTGFMASAVAPTNIAVIKYWGKRDVDLNLPINSSLSVTLDTNDMKTVTTVEGSEEFERDRVWLNGEEQKVAGNKRLEKVFAEMRRRAQDKVDPISGEIIVAKSVWKTMHIHVKSSNSFPTAAGLASSASGYACLVKALAELMNVTGEITEVARMGSGSASRSLYGGYVKWDRGSKDDGTDSIAKQVASETHWPEMHALICVVSEHKKTVSSTGGMLDSVKTSDLLAYRASKIVPERIVAMEAAIQARDFASFADLTMKDSNSFHATCLDTFPPIRYLTDTSFALIQFVHRMNKLGEEVICAYTFDAGPNAVIFVREQHVNQVLTRLLQEFGPRTYSASEFNFVQGRTEMSIKNVLKDHPSTETLHQGSIHYIIHTKVGNGAFIQKNSEQ